MNPVKTAAVTASYIFRHRANKTALPVFLVSLAACAAVFFIAWLPAAMDRGAIKRALSAAVDEIKGKECAARFMAEYGGAKASAAAAMKKLSHQAGAGDILKKMNLLAVPAGLKLSLENTGNKNERAGEYEVMIQDIVVTGSYRGLRAFLYGLENMEVFTVLRKVRIDREGKTPGMIKAGIQLALYVKTPAKEEKQ